MLMRNRISLLLLPAISLVGVPYSLEAAPPGSNLLWIGGGDVVFEMMRITLLFGAGGLVFAAVGFLLLSSLGAFRRGWPPPGLLRKTAAVGLIIICVVLGLIAGFLESVRFAGEKLLTAPGYREKVLPKVGRFGADLTASLYYAAPDVIDLSPDARFRPFPRHDLAAFQSGDQPISKKELENRLDRLAHLRLRRVVFPLVEKLQTPFPRVFRFGTIFFFDPLLDQIQDQTVDALVQSAGRKYGLRVLGKSLRRAVSSAATVTGGPDEIFRAPLAKAFSEQAVISALRFSLVGFVRTWQTNVFALFLLALCLPVVFFRLTAVFQPRRRSSRSTRFRRTV